MQGAPARLRLAQICLDLHQLAEGRAENYAALNKAMRGMIDRHVAEPTIVVPEKAKAQGHAATDNRTLTLRARQIEQDRRPSDLINKVRDTVKAIAAERAESQLHPLTESVKPTKPLEAPMSAAIQPRPLAKEPQPGTPVASNPTRQKQLIDEEWRRKEADRIARLQKSLAIARQRGRGGPER